MLKTTTLFALTLVLPWALAAQNYSFSPSNEIYGVLEMDMYTEHYMYIGHDSPDSAHITWRVIENTCPEGWDIQACDYQHCYTGLPNDGDMSPVAPGQQGYLRMIVNPFLIAGNGMLHLLIFPTGEPLNFVDAYYYFNTTLANLEDSDSVESGLIITASEILYTGPISGALQLYSLSGAILQETPTSYSSVRMPIDALSPGAYLLRLPSGNCQKFIKLH